MYLETYIWKVDAPGREFKEQLARKAAEGHGKMTKKLVFPLVKETGTCS